MGSFGLALTILLVLIMVPFKTGNPGTGFTLVFVFAKYVTIKSLRMLGTENLWRHRQV